MARGRSKTKLGFTGIKFQEEENKFEKKMEDVQKRARGLDSPQA